MLRNITELRGYAILATDGDIGTVTDFSPIADAATESVEELVDTGQAYEAEIVAGVEDAADHPERMGAALLGPCTLVALGVGGAAPGGARREPQVNAMTSLHRHPGMRIC